MNPIGCRVAVSWERVIDHRKAIALRRRRSPSIPKRQPWCRKAARCLGLDSWTKPKPQEFLGAFLARGDFAGDLNDFLPKHSLDQRLK
jgi:hypothetical protein